jgi:transposase
MKLKDARHLPPEAQEALRYRVVNAIENGMSKSEAARVFQVSRTAVHHWTKAVDEQGAKALKAKQRGRRHSSRLAPHEAATTVRLLTQKCPDPLGLPFALWTHASVGQLLEQRYGVSVSVWTVGRYLKRWGLTPQKPLRRAYEQDPKAVKQWLEVDYPALVKQAKQEGAQIHWGDEMGLRADDQTGRSYSKRGQTPVVLGTGQRFRCNLISTLTNQGKLYFQLFTQTFNGDVMLNFLRRLIRQIPQKVFLIVDKHPVHLSAKVNRWLDQHADRIRMFLLPSYSPELNPDELLNHDVKANAVGRKRAKTKVDMMENVRRHLRRRQRQPEVIQRFFREKHVANSAH